MACPGARILCRDKGSWAGHFQWGCGHQPPSPASGWGTEAGWGGTSDCQVPPRTIELPEWRKWTQGKDGHVWACKEMSSLPKGRCWQGCGHHPTTADLAGHPAVGEGDLEGAEGLGAGAGGWVLRQRGWGAGASAGALTAVAGSLCQLLHGAPGAGVHGAPSTTLLAPPDNCCFAPLQRGEQTGPQAWVGAWTVLADA